ncbi:MAG: lipocalin family protein [Gammaproteobacteria bacterium]
MLKKFAVLPLLLLSACVGVPEGLQPVTGFELESYLGRWYEIARLDHSFERGLEQVSATYTLREDGGVEVLNRGYDPAEKEWQEALGKAYFVDSPDIAHLKVSFFGPFYGSYVVIELDKPDYNYALVAGPDRSYLWLLARTPELDPAIVEQLVERARQYGFATDQLIRVKHGAAAP